MYSKPPGKGLAHHSESTSLHNMKFLNFFLFLWAILPSLDRYPDPDLDPQTQLNPDPGQKHCFLHF
jgi:hypothetical protein